MALHHPRIRPYGVYPPEKEMGEQLLAREVIHFAFYMPHDHPDLAAGVSHAFDCYMNAVGEGPDTINACAIGSSGYGPLSDERRTRIPQLLLPDRPFRYAEDCADPYRLREMEKSGNETWIHLGNEHDRLAGFKFTYSARIPSRDRSPSEYDVSYLEGTLSTEYLEEHGPTAVRELMLDLASGLHFASGHAGLSFDSLVGDMFFTPRIRTELLRHPGISLNHGSIPDWMGTQVDGVHWLNFLGPPVLQELGGVSALRSRLHSPETTVQAIDETRALVTLGTWPEAGDLSRGDTLPAYHEFGRALEPWLDSPSLAPVSASTDSPRKKP
ncbi:type VI immunity family protein [Archangium sp.]|uniref:type VI immunity family protein n=1 Tax=Archangium sp. TaxID=1872627 RepID=UPI00389A768B